MRISVVIPTMNGGERFKEVLARVFSQESDFPIEVLCVDSESDDGTPGFAKDAGARVISIPRRSFNHGTTRNMGIRETRGELVVLVVQDALPSDRYWLSNLAESVAEDEKAAGGYSRQVPRDGCNPIIKDRLMNWSASRPDRAVQELGLDREFDALTPMEKLSLISFDNVSSCVRRSVWEEHPFPERDFGEDVAWGLGVIKSGYRIIYEPSSAVIHSHNNSVWYEFKRIYSDHGNLNQLIGLTTVPLFRDIAVNGGAAFRHYLKLIKEAGHGSFERWYRSAGALPYAYLENLAQYLGARLNRRMKERSGFAAAIDRWLRKGV